MKRGLMSDKRVQFCMYCGHGVDSRSKSNFMLKLETARARVPIGACPSGFLDEMEASLTIISG